MKKSPIRIRIDAYLADGEWRTFPEILAACGPTVPPGQAVRKGERERLRQHSRNGTAAPATRYRGTQDTSHRVGASRIVYDALQTAVRFRSIERSNTTPRRYRITTST